MNKSHIPFWDRLCINWFYIATGLSLMAFAISFVSQEYLFSLLGVVLAYANLSIANKEISKYYEPKTKSK